MPGPAGACGSISTVCRQSSSSSSSSHPLSPASAARRGAVRPIVAESYRQAVGRDTSSITSVNLFSFARSSPYLRSRLSIIFAVARLINHLPLPAAAEQTGDGERTVLPCLV